MGISKEIEDLSSVYTEAQVLRNALKLSLSLSGGSSGHVIIKTRDDMWEVDGKRNIYIPPAVIEGLSGMVSFSMYDNETSRFILKECNININRVIPIKIEGVLEAALLLDNENDAGTDSMKETCLSLIGQYVSVLLSNIKMREEMRDMQAYYRDIIVKSETAEKLASLGTIAAGLAHEIKNPLVSIKTLAQLLPEKFDDPEFRGHFTNIAINEIDRIGHIVSDLLDFAKSDELKIETIDIKKVIEGIIVMLSPQFAKNKIIVSHRFSENIPLIYSDQFQLKQVLLNLFLNSIEAIPCGGEIIVDIRGAEGIINDTGVILKITDTGTGIREEDKPHMFEPFFTTKGTGTGLGLSICKRIIEKHHGKINIESVYNEGTTVTLTLPVKWVEEQGGL